MTNQLCSRIFCKPEQLLLFSACTARCRTMTSVKKTHTSSDSLRRLFFGGGGAAVGLTTARVALGSSSADPDPTRPETTHHKRKRTSVYTHGQPEEGSAGARWSIISVPLSDRRLPCRGKTQQTVLKQEHIVRTEAIEQLVEWSVKQVLRGEVRCSVWRSFRLERYLCTHWRNERPTEVVAPI